MSAEIKLFPSAQRRGTIRKWAQELYRHHDQARANILAARLRVHLHARLRLGIDEPAAQADTHALENAVWIEIARLESISGRVA